MSMYQKAKDKALAVNDKIDSKVDAQIDKAQESRFSGLIFVGVVAVMLIIVGLLAAN